MIPLDWHYPRPALARQYLDALESGAFGALTLFSPRRTGKTAFLLEDLAPAAVKAGWFVVYADLWQDKTDARAALAYALEKALETLTVPASRAGRLLRTPVRKITLLGSGVDLGEEAAPSQPENPYVRIDALLAEILRRKKRVLLLVDEVQQLAVDKGGDALVAALRSTLTVHRKQVQVIFTGSSRSQLAKLFSTAKAPLFGFSAILEFPLLGRAFAAFAAERYKTTTKRAVSVEALWEAFVAFEHRPRELLELVADMALHQGTDVAAYLARHRAAAREAYDYPSQWQALTAIEREVLLRVLHTKPLYSREGLDELRGRVGLDRLAVATVQRAVDRLCDEHLLRATGERGKYELESAAFAEWLRTVSN